MSDDDELRERLRGIPAPGARIDTEAVIAGAKRRRRPKTIALSSAATVAGVLIVAPLVVPGLPMLQPTDSSVMVDSGAAPESAEQAEESAAGARGDEEQGGGADGSESAAPEDAGEDSSGASGDAWAGAPEGPSYPLDASLAWCGLDRAGDAGLALRMLAEPAAEGPGAGSAQVEVTNLGASTVELEVAPVVGVEVAAAGGSIIGGKGEALTLAPGGSAVLDATTAVLPAGVCGDGTPSADLPLAIVELAGAGPMGIVGDPWSGDVR